jgi:TPR repeat protein
MFCLGQALFHGDGLNVNRTQGLYWLMKAANRGSKEACFQLGTSYHNGCNVPRRYDLAAKWFRKAANWGCTQCMVRLGNAYRHGLGVEQNLIAAYVCIIVASKRTAIHPGSLLRLWGFEELTDEQRAEVRRLSETMVNGKLDF